MWLNIFKNASEIVQSGVLVISIDISSGFVKKNVLINSQSSGIWTKPWIYLSKFLQQLFYIRIHTGIWFSAWKNRWCFFWVKIHFNRFIKIDSAQFRTNWKIYAEIHTNCYLLQYIIPKFAKKKVFWYFQCTTKSIVVI